MTQDDYYRNQGRYLKVPECCIEFFVLLMRYKIPPSQFMDEYLGPDDEDCGYVRCPKCRLKREEKCLGQELEDENGTT